MSANNRDSEQAIVAEDLLASVTAQVAAYRRLLELGQRKQEILVSGDIQALALLLPQEQEALAHLVGLETAYAHGSAQVARIYQLAPTDRYEELATAITEPLRSRLSREVAELRQLANLLQTLVESNSELISRARSHIDFLLHHANRVVGQAAYDGRGLPTIDAGARSLSTRL